MEVIKERHLPDARFSSSPASSSARRAAYASQSSSPSTTIYHYSLPSRPMEERQRQLPQQQQPKQPKQQPDGLFRLDAKQHYNYLGRTGLRVSSIGLGTWVTFANQVNDSVADDLLTLAYACGINLFDTAEAYASGLAEDLLGRLLQRKTWRRSSYIISTKICWGGEAATECGLSRKRIVEGLLASLQRLRVSYVDLVFANRPDPNTTMEEIVRAFTFCINQGWAFYWGTSRWSPTEVMEAHSVARQFNLIPPSAEQVEYSLFQRDKLGDQLIDLQRRLGIGLLTWSPLAGGILSGKYDDGVPTGSRASLKGYSRLRLKILSEEGRHQQATLRRLCPLAEQLNCSLAQLAIAWCLRNRSVHCVLLGASCASQLYEDILAVLVAGRLTPQIMDEIGSVVLDTPGSEPQDPAGQNISAADSSAVS